MTIPLWEALRYFGEYYEPCQFAKLLSSIQIKPKGEELCSEQPHRPRVPGAAWQLTRQPALALTRIVVELCGPLK